MTRSIGLGILLVMTACGPAANVDAPQSDARPADDPCPAGEDLVELRILQPDGSTVPDIDGYVCGTAPVVVVESVVSGLCALPSCGGPPWALPCGETVIGSAETGYTCTVLSAP